MTPPERQAMRLNLYEKQNGRCRWCNQLMLRPRSGVLKRPWPRNTATIDHVMPLTRGGTDARSNLVLACHYCNTKKADSLPAAMELAL